MNNIDKKDLYTSKFDIKKESELKKNLENNGFIFKPVDYAFWRASNNCVTATLYLSGKIVVQGKDTESFTKTYLNEQLELSEQPAAKLKYSSWIGTDESGKGDYFGPLVIAGVSVDADNIKKLQNLNVRDSKKMRDAEIEQTAWKIKANSTFSVIVINPAKYNELYAKFKNLNKLLAWGHAKYNLKIF